jgi:sugar-specific transcriptional regulator TrmB
MNDDIKTLNKIGLSQKQAIVYIAMLELGEAKITDIAKRANLKRPTVYLIIEELELLGLVSQIIKGKSKIYSAIHPRRINELLEFRKNKFQELLPSLIVKYKSASGRPRTQMLEGMEAIRQSYREALTSLTQNNCEQLWISNLSSIMEKFPEIMGEYSRVLNKFPKSNIREILFGKGNINEWLKKTKRNKNHQTKYINDQNFGGETDQLITRDKLFFFAIHPEPFVLIIESEEMAKTQKFLFENIWKTI